MSDFIHKNSCRICGQSNFTKILDLGEMPPANAFLKKEDLDKPEPKFPLVVYFCNNCALLQLLDVVNPGILFRDYHYLTSASSPLVEHFREMANELVDRFAKASDDLIVEIGGNDGVLLGSIKNRCRVLNIEPAESIARLSVQNGVETINDFFSSELARDIVDEYGMAKIVVANNVIAHIDNLEDVFRGVEKLIGEKGIFVLEVHWVGNLIGDGGFDQIYHEHLSYFSLVALNNLASQYGLNIFDAQLVPIHGQCLRAYASKNGDVLESVGDLLRKEKELGLGKVETFLKFADKVYNNKIQLRELLMNLKRQGKKIVGYGAPAKGNTLLNYFGIDNSILDFVTETTPLKQGTYTPGTHIPVFSSEKLYEANPDYALLLAWNYADAIIEKEEEYRNKGGRFIIPVPEVKII